ncbi:ABC transporter substrate-binding protein [Antarctobacter jejuensis]|uniref:ABC transporter substrate-binding protein n=1 Tax=Antarctobacter jejuensis TaxID=1439938 RepID=UPI003FD055DB
MDKFIYAVYLVLSAVGLSIGLRIIWAFATGRKINFGPLMTFLALVGVVAAYYFWQREDVYSRLQQDRIARAEAADSPVYVAAVWPADEPEFFDGMRRAVDRLNAEQGVRVRDAAGEEVTLAVKLLEFRQAEENDRTYLKVAENDRIMAVVGHRSETEAILASAAYQEAGVLYLAPTVSRPSFSEHRFDRVLRLVPDDEVIAKEIADFIWSRGYRDIVVLTPRTEAGKNMARYLSYILGSETASKNRVDTPRVRLYRSYDPAARHFHELVTEVEEKDPSAILVVDGAVGTARVVREMRIRNVDAPIVAFPMIEVQTFFEIAGSFSDGVVIPSLMPFEDADPDPASRQTVDDADSGEPTGFVEAQANEAVMLLGRAWERAATIEPGATAAVLRGIKGWEGRFGSYDFLPNGDISNRQIQFKQSKAGQFHAIQD